MVDTTEPQNEACSKGLRADATEVAVSDFSIVKRFDVIEDIGTRFASRLIPAPR
jgi:hypothetical protein